MKNNIIDLPLAESGAHKKPPTYYPAYQRIVKPASLKLIEHIAKKIMPITVIAAEMEVNIYHFLSILKVSHEIQGAIIKGETDTFEREWNAYQATLGHFERNLPLKDSTGTIIIPKVQPIHVGLRMKHWDTFFKKFMAFSFTYRASQFSITEDQQTEEPDYVKLRDQIMTRINALTGIEKTMKKQMTFQPAHYAHSMILKGKGKVEKDGKIILQNPAKTQKPNYD